jgi:hypothetical protein
MRKKLEKKRRKTVNQYARERERERKIRNKQKEKNLY